MEFEKVNTMNKKNQNKRSNTMRRSIYLFTLLTLFVIGCSEESSVLAPVNNVSTNEPNWITLPVHNSLSINGDVSVSKMLYGTDESLLEINTGYTGGPFGYINITANSRFQRNSFTGQRYTTMSVNDKFGTATFSPSGTFSKPVIYNLTIMGVDLSKVDPTKVSFVYMAPNGSYYKPVYDRIYVEKQSGKLQIVNAQLPHFSRYGFVN
jgi:hypothetical protein